MNLASPFQHTRCCIAVTAIRAVLSMFSGGGNSKLDKHMLKIQRWLDACTNDVRHKKPSSRAEKELDAFCDRMDARMNVTGLQDDELYLRWAASVWAALTLLEDCRNTCPDWFKGKHWKYLLQTLNTLAEGLAKLDEAVPEQGTKIYLEVAA